MNAPNASGWKPETPVAGDTGEAPATSTGNRALMLEEPLIFEIGTTGTTGVDLPEPVASGSDRPRRCAITPASAARTTPSTWGCFRSEAAP
jgi:hypothetical protein